MVFRKKLLHVFPKEDLSDVDYYLSRSRLPGMLPLEELGLKLYGYPLRPLKLQDESFSKDGRTDIVSIGVGTGGIIQEWIPGNGPQLFNHAGWAGRSMNQTLFVTKPGFHSNPTWAGDKYDAFFPEHVNPKIPAPPLHYSQSTLIHGARMLQLERTDNFLKTQGIPLEWDPDGTWEGTNHGGGVMDAVELSDLRFSFEIDMHWGKPGLHRVTSLAHIPYVPEEYNLKWGALPLFLRFGYDDIIAYNAEAKKFTSILDRRMCPGLRTTVLNWEDKGRYILATLAKVHGREAETRQNVQLIAPGGFNIVESCIFMDGPTSKRMRIDPKPDYAMPDSPDVSAVAAYQAEMKDVQARYGFQNKIAIGGGTGLFNDTDQTGSYPADIFGNQGNAVIYVSKQGSDNPWSFNQDAAVGLFLPYVDNISGALGTKSQRHMRWISKRGGGVPTNGHMDSAVMILGDTYQWNAGLYRPSGLLKSTAYLCTGTMAQVAEMMSYLSTEVDHE